MWKSYPDGKIWTEPSDSLEFRRFLDLTIGYSVNRTIWERFSVPSPLRALSIDRTPPSLVPRTFAAFSTIDTNRIQLGYISTIRGLTSPLRSHSNLPWLSWWCRFNLVRERDKGRQGRSEGLRTLSWHDADTFPDILKLAGRYWHG